MTDETCYPLVELENAKIAIEEEVGNPGQMARADAPPALTRTYVLLRA
jgi:hypothetical protein